MRRFLPNLTHKTFRRLSVLVMALCCLLLVTTITFWVRSHGQYDTIGVTNEIHKLQFTAHKGVFYFQYTRNYLYSSWTPGSPTPATPATISSTYRFYAYRSDPQNWPFEFGKSPWGIIKIDGSRLETTMSPMYVPLGTALGIPVLFFIATLATAGVTGLLLYIKHRHPKSHCQSCGYNLSGNPSAPTCPECGQATPNTST